MGSGGFPNDVALFQVIVPNNLDLSKNIIPLASGSDLFVNKNCVISGWGRTGMENKSFFSSTIKYGQDSWTCTYLSTAQN